MEFDLELEEFLEAALVDGVRQLEEGHEHQLIRATPAQNCVHHLSFTWLRKEMGEVEGAH